MCQEYGKGKLLPQPEGPFPLEEKNIITFVVLGKKVLLLTFKWCCDFSFEVTLHENIERKDGVLDNVVSCWLALSYCLFGVFCGGGKFLK